MAVGASRPFAVAELGKRVLFTLGMLVVYRIGGHITIPGVNLAALARPAGARTMFGLYDMFSGNNLSKMTVFALGIMPYITASIILQLLTVVAPTSRSSRRKASSAGGRSRSYTRYGTIVLSRAFNRWGLPSGPMADAAGH